MIMNPETPSPTSSHRPSSQHPTAAQFSGEVSRKKRAKDGEPDGGSPVKKQRRAKSVVFDDKVMTIKKGVKIAYEDIQFEKKGDSKEKTKKSDNDSDEDDEDSQENGGHDADDEERMFGGMFGEGDGDDEEKSEKSEKKSKGKTVEREDHIPDMPFQSHVKNIWGVFANEPAFEFKSKKNIHFLVDALAPREGDGRELAAIRKRYREIVVEHLETREKAKERDSIRLKNKMDQAATQSFHNSFGAPECAIPFFRVFKGIVQRLAEMDPAPIKNRNLDSMVARFAHFDDDPSNSELFDKYVGPVEDKKEEEAENKIENGNENENGNGQAEDTDPDATESARSSSPEPSPAPEEPVPIKTEPRLEAAKPVKIKQERDFFSDLDE